jgi:hypothetical protein
MDGFFRVIQLSFKWCESWFEICYLLTKIWTSDQMVVYYNVYNHLESVLPKKNLILICDLQVRRTKKVILIPGILFQNDFLLG